MMRVEVQTATLRKQTLRDAPASVTVVTAQDIRRNGYRTLSEVLANVRSFYVNSDSAFHFAGVRGFSLLGDYNTRTLVMINGHHLTDSVYGAMYYFGDDFPLDMDLVEQIEIVRGPSSALYGSNGLFATINVITKSASTAPRMHVSAQAGSFGSEKVTASSAFALGRDAKLLLSASGTRASGRSVVFPELVDSAFPNRIADVERERGYHLFANLSWKNWTVMTAAGQFEAVAPIGWYGATPGSTVTQDLEARNFVDASWDREFGARSAVQWRTWYDQFRYDGAYDYLATDDYVNFDGALGDQVGSRFIYSHDTDRFGHWTAGAETSLDVRNTQYDYNVSSAETGSMREDIFRISELRRGVGVFVQDELPIAKKLDGVPWGAS